jgi:hypothetical protein
MPKRGRFWMKTAMRRTGTASAQRLPTPASSIGVTVAQSHGAERPPPPTEIFER